jgi:uncharacterized membrane protein YedE/YeeE
MKRTDIAVVQISRGAVTVPKWASLGALFGLVCAAAIALYGPIGVSSTYARFIGATLRRLAPKYAGENPYLLKMGSLVAPETMLVVGLLIGGYLAARIGRTRAAPAIEIVHPHETTPLRRYIDAFVGGLLILFGARLAGGCTSGLIISGITQLSVSGLLFGAAVFASGISVALALRERAQR